MKKLLFILALLTIVTAPAFAGRSEHSSRSEGLYTRAHKDDAATARAQAYSYPGSSFNVYDASGAVIGADPDANVRLQLQRNHNVN